MEKKPSFKELLEQLKKQNKADLLMQGLQLKFNKENVNEDNDKREKQLENINVNLDKIQKAISGNTDTVKVLPKNIADKLNVKLSDLNVKEEDKTFTENLKEVVGSLKSGFQSLEQGINNTFNQGFKFLSNPLGSIKEGLKNISAKGKEKLIQAKDYVKDVAGTKAGFTAEEGRFVEEYKKQKQPSAFGMSEEQGKALTEKATAGFRQTKDLEQKIQTTEASIEKSKKLGFEATPEDTQKLEELKKLKSEVDVRGDTFTGSVTEAKFKPDVFKEPAGTIQAQERAPVEAPEQRLKEVESKKTTNEESDNVISAQESIADSFKENNELIKELLSTTKEQLNSINSIKDSLTPKASDDEESQQQKKQKFYGDVTGRLEEISGKLDKLDNISGGGGGLLDAAKGLMDLGGGGKRGPGGRSIPGSKLGKLATISKVGGAALAVAGGAYTAYEGYTAAEDSKEAKLKDVQAQLESGKIDEKQASQLRKDIGNTATVEKSGAVGEGTGMAAGGIAGMKIGAALGSFVGPVGTVVGGLAGGAIGAFAGSKLGKKAGELGGSVINYFKGDKKQEVPAAATQTVPATPPVVAPPTATQTSVEKKKPELTSATVDKKPTEASKTAKTTAKEDYTKDERYQKLLQEEQEVIKGRNVRTAGEGMEASETLSASQMREAEREAKTRYLEKTSVGSKPAAEKSKDVVSAKEQKNASLSIEPAKKEPSPLSNLSVEYNDKTREMAQTKPAPAPIVMNNSSSNNSTSFVPIKPSPRIDPNGSPLERYQSRITTF